MHQEDLSWLPTYFPGIRVFAYAANDSLAPYHQREPWGREAGAFLSFLVDHYDRVDELPDVLVFLHGHRFAYHTFQQDAVVALSRLRWEEISRYTSLNVHSYQQKEPGYNSEHPRSLRVFLTKSIPLLTVDVAMVVCRL